VLTSKRRVGRKKLSSTQVFQQKHYMLVKQACRESSEWVDTELAREIAAGNKPGGTMTMADNQQLQETVPHEASPKQPRRPRVVTGLVLVLVAVIAGAIWGVTRSAGGGGTATSAPPHATATSAPPRVLYQSDWSQGADGWNLPTGAKIVDDHLELAGIDALSLQIPYVPTTQNYAVEMDYLLQATMRGGRFGVTSRNAAGDQLYAVSMQCTPEAPIPPGTWDNTNGACSGVVLELTPGGTYPSGFYTTDYTVGTGAQTFGVEARGNTVAMCPVKGDCVVPVTSAKPLGSAQHLSIETRAVKIQITRVVVMTL
jgi:hypothetical protein